MINNNMPAKKKAFIGLSELAEKMGISRIAVYKQVKKGKIPAQKIGRNYAVPIEFAEQFLPEDGDLMTDEKRTDIERAVKKVVEEYGETLRLLAKE